MSSIALADLLAAIRFCAERTAIAGAVNAVGPAPVTNREFTRALGRALHRPAFLPLPAFALRLLFGEMANELFFASQRVLPRRLVAEGFTFLCPDLASTFASALGP